MTVNKNYLLLYIYKTRDTSQGFDACVYDEVAEIVKVSKTMNNEIMKGRFYRGDVIQIIEETPFGVIFTLSTEKIENVDLPEKYNLQFLISYDYLRFLNGTLPFSTNETEILTKIGLRKLDDKTGAFTGTYLIDDIEIPSISTVLPPSFVCKIVAKTRINMYANAYNPFFFVIGSSNGMFVKIIFWKETLVQYSDLNVNDVIQVIDYKKKFPGKMPVKLIYNTLHEHVYFNCQEISAKSICKIQLQENNRNNKTENITTSSIKRLFHQIEGRITYTSVLYKYRIAEQFYEYFLIRCGEHLVVLFNNSDDLFYSLAGKDIVLYEMRKIERGGAVFYLSTIYTEFHIKDSVISFDPLSLDSSPRKKKIKIQSCVSGAIGFLPDNYVQLDELLYSPTEIINGHEYHVEEFLKPACVNPDVFNSLSLSINELKKFYFKDTVVFMQEEDCCELEFVLMNKTNKQRFFSLEMKSGIKVYSTYNYLTNESSIIKDITPETIAKFTNLPKYFFVDVVRVSFDTVFIYLTGYLELDAFADSSLLVSSELK